MQDVSELLRCNPANAEMFFDYRRRDRAIEECLNCPAMFACQEAARREGHVHGVWGAETAEERCHWLVENHPDDEVRSAAKLELEEYEYRRQKARERRKTNRPPLKSGLSKTAQFRKAMHERGAAQRQATAAQVAKARELRATGLLVRDIASDMGIPVRSVERYLSRKYDHLTA